MGNISYILVLSSAAGASTPEHYAGANSRGPGPRSYHAHLIQSRAVVCQNMIRSCNPEGENHLTPSDNSVEKLAIHSAWLRSPFPYQLNISLCNSWPFPLLLLSWSLQEQVMTFLTRRLSPAETIKITTSSSKRVRSLIIPQGIFPALTGKRVGGAAIARTGRG